MTEVDELIGAGAFVEADRRAQRALSTVANETARRQLLAGLAGSYTRHARLWAKPVGFTPRDLALYWEDFGAGPRNLSAAFMETADSLKRAGQLEDARKYFEAAAVIMAAFGDTSDARGLALQGIWESALAAGDVSDALLAAKCFRDLTPDDDVYSIFAEEMLGTAFLAMESPREAVPHLEKLLEWWQRIDREKHRDPSPPTLRAQRLLTRAREEAAREKES